MNESWGKTNYRQSDYAASAIKNLLKGNLEIRGSEAHKWLYQTVRELVSEKQYKLILVLSIYQPNKEKLIEVLQEINPTPNINELIYGSNR